LSVLVPLALALHQQAPRLLVPPTPVATPLALVTVHLRSAKPAHLSWFSELSPLLSLLLYKQEKMDQNFLGDPPGFVLYLLVHDTAMFLSDEF
jgi:hypothetical protein